jgi:DnaK suppressor protein
VGRFELPTSCSQSKRATRLRYTPKKAANDTLSALGRQLIGLLQGPVICYKVAFVFGGSCNRMAVELTRKSFTPYAAKKGEEYMNARQRSHFRKILEALKSELSEEIDRTVHTMQDEATVFADPNDRASQESDMALELRNRDRERKLIKKIDETIARIDANEYGYCESCGVEIGLKRLEARPTATLCIDCKTLDELRERQVAK